LIIWNRYAGYDAEATEFERRGARVLVAENGYLGREWRGNFWYALALGYHNGAGQYPPVEPAELDCRVQELFSGQLEPWRPTPGGPVVVLQTRSIGVPTVAEPRGWSQTVAGELERAGVAVILRGHPGAKPDDEGLSGALRGASAVLTWGSSAALKAVLAGVPAFYGFPRWIGAPGGRFYQGPASLAEPYIGDRSALLRSLAFAFWRLDEITQGRPFAYLLRNR
jgi:hypothetical protein